MKNCWGGSNVLDRSTANNHVWWHMMRPMWAYKGKRRVLVVRIYRVASKSGADFRPVVSLMLNMLVDSFLGISRKSCNVNQIINLHPRRPPPLKQWLTQFGWLKPLGKQWWKYCWWLKFCTTWDVWNPINNGINYQPQLVQDFSHQQY